MNEQQLVEAVAQAIANARHGVGTWWRLNEVECRDFEHQATAALSILKPEIEAMREALECARLDLNHLATKYGEQEFVAPTICRITALNGGPTNAKRNTHSDR